MSEQLTQAEMAEKLKKGGWENRKQGFKFILFRIRKSPLSLLGIALTSFFIVLALLAPMICAPNNPDPYRMIKTISRLPLSPSWEHLMGKK